MPSRGRWSRADIVARSELNRSSTLSGGAPGAGACDEESASFGTHSTHCGWKQASQCVGRQKWV